MNVIEFPTTKITKFKDSKESFLKVCKTYLTEEDYMLVCTCILDPDEFEKAETQIQNIVETFFSQ